MKKYSTLAVQLIGLARNGVMGHVTTTMGIKELTLLQPKLLGRLEPKERDIFLLELSRSLRTLLAWFRDYKRHPSVRKTVLKNLKVGDEALLDGVVANLLLCNKDEGLFWGRAPPLQNSILVLLIEANRH